MELITSGLDMDVCVCVVSVNILRRMVPYLSHHILRPCHS